MCVLLKVISYPPMICLPHFGNLWTRWSQKSLCCNILWFLFSPHLFTVSGSDMVMKPFLVCAKKPTGLI